jgi:transposase
MELRMENKTNWKHMSREERGHLIFEDKGVKQVPKGWRVKSQSYSGAEYLVKYEQHTPKCNCPDCQITKQKCKHIYAVEFYLKQSIDEEGKITQTKGIKVTYGQKWSAYNKAQTNEKLLFMELLNDLCQYAPEPEYKFGRPSFPMKDLVFSSAMKIYTTFSGRRFISDLQIAKEKNYLEKVPHYNSVFNFLNNKEITPILKQLIKISALPLSSIETEFAVDSSGFSTSRFARYYNNKYKNDSSFRFWLKAHLVSGVKSNIIVNCEITKAYGHDSPQLKPLLEGVNKERWNFKEISCDKAYSSFENLELINDMGAVPYIPFKSIVRGTRRGTAIWKKMYHYFIYKHEDFLQHYHKRSNAETVFHMIKTKFRDNLRSKSETSMENELLLKVLCHNICVVIQEMMELGIKAEFVVEEKVNIENN